MKANRHTEGITLIEMTLSITIGAFLCLVLVATLQAPVVQFWENQKLIQISLKMAELRGLIKEQFAQVDPRTVSLPEESNVIVYRRTLASTHGQLYIKDGYLYANVPKTTFLTEALANQVEMLGLSNGLLMNAKLILQKENNFLFQADLGVNTLESEHMALTLFGSEYMIAFDPQTKKLLRLREKVGAGEAIALADELTNFSLRWDSLNILNINYTLSERGSSEYTFVQQIFF